MTRYDFSKILRRADCLIIVPPFAGLDRPSLAAHVLQACAAEAGLSVSVLYANVLLAAAIGEMNYEAICYAPSSGLIGERFFAAAAYGVRPLGRGEQTGDDHFKRVSKNINLKINLDELERLEACAAQWADEVAEAIARLNFPVVGCTTTFEQTSASIALLNRMKRLRGETLTILGGANCEGELAEGIHSLGAAVDVVFSGESEVTFPKFLKAALAGGGVNTKTVQGEPCLVMDGIPTPSFEEFYEQYQQSLPDGILGRSNNIWLPYESSRGCWWGEKHHCTFCGINGQTMKFREKSPDRVLSELKRLLPEHPSRKVCMVDNIMPHTYFKTLLSRLAEELPGLHLFYEQKANLSLDQVAALKAAGVAVIQPGIEALSTSLLKRMDKGVRAKQNLALLRYARAVDLSVNWNLLYSFPGDELREYEETLQLLPLLRHLHPPTGVFHLSIDRFSPYFNNPAKYGVTNIRPMEGYASVLPQAADAFKMSYHFVADYESGSRGHPEIIRELFQEVDEWRVAWESATAAPPMLAVSRVGKDAFLLVDTRGLPGTRSTSFIDAETAAVVLGGCRYDETQAVSWAITNKAAVEIDSWVVPLVTATPDIIREFEAKRKQCGFGGQRVALEVVR